MFPVGKANFFILKKDFGATAAIKQWRRLCRIWGGADLVAVRGGGGRAT